MNDQVTLPPERKLSQQRRREIGVVLDRASRSAREPRRTRWALVPAMALAAVVALVLGLTHTGELAMPVVGAPTPSTDTVGPPTDGATPTSSSPIPSARSIDRGPLSEAAAHEVATECDCGDRPRYVVRQMLFARHTSTHGDVVIYVGGDGTIYAHASNPFLGMGGPGAPSRPEPSRERPVVQWTGTLTTSGAQESTGTTYYRVGPDVASVQLRVVVDGQVGPWFEASMAGGYAWAAASAHHDTRKDDDPGLADDVRVEDRAFDAQGRLLDIDHE